MELTILKAKRTMSSWGKRARAWSSLYGRHSGLPAAEEDAHVHGAHYTVDIADYEQLGETRTRIQLTIR